MLKIIFFLLFAYATLFAQNKALEAFQSKEYNKAFKLYTQEANKGDAKAQSALSYLYLHGLGAPKNIQKSQEYLEKSASAGYVNAQYDLGMNYLIGNHQKQNDEKAFLCLSKAAEQGHADAQYNLALMYYNGKATDVDAKKTAELLESAALQGHKKAQKVVGVIFMQVLEFDKAEKWLKLNAQEGDEKAKELLKEIQKTKKG
jgi:TPR repeat protein